jgi:hypothetical protein
MPLPTQSCSRLRWRRYPCLEVGNWISCLNMQEPRADALPVASRTRSDTRIMVASISNTASWHAESVERPPGPT